MDDPGPGPRGLQPEELEALRSELSRRSSDRQPARWNADPEEARRSLLKLVLTLTEFLRALMERQAIRRMDEGTLTEQDIEALGTALMRLEETIHELAAQFDISPEELQLDLGPLGRLL